MLNPRIERMSKTILLANMDIDIVDNMHVMQEFPSWIIVSYLDSTFTEKEIYLQNEKSVLYYYILCLMEKIPTLKGECIY